MVPAHKRCRPPKRTLTRVEPSSSSHPGDAATAIVKAREIEREAVAEAKALAKEAAEAARIAEQASAQTKRVREFSKRGGERDLIARRIATSKTSTTAAKVSRKRTHVVTKPKARRIDEDEPIEDDEEPQRVRKGAPRLPSPPLTKTSRPEGYTPGMLRFAVEDGAVEPESAYRAFPLNPCDNIEYREFAPDEDEPVRRTKWASALKTCAGSGTKGLGRIGRTEALKLKNKLIGKKLGTKPPAIDDIDPYAFQKNPCNGMSYKSFRSPFTRKDAYWNRAAGKEHGPGKRKVDSEQGRLKRLAWQEQLHHCAMRVYINRARVSKNPKVRAVAEGYRSAVTVDASEFLDGLAKKRKAKKRKARR